jgi:hypothetical protein
MLLRRRRRTIGGMPTKARERLPVSGEPWIVERSPRRVAVLRTTGDPTAAARRAVPALYRSVYALKMRRKREGRDFRVEPLRARWPNADGTPREEWVGLWALPVPDDVDALPGQEDGIELQTWEYGPTAEIEHAGPYSTEGPTLLRLHRAVEELGYEQAGPHEEEYLTRPGSPQPRTLIRYRVRRRR